MFNPTSKNSIQQTYDLVNELMLNKTKLYNFYKQSIFNETATIDTCNSLKENVNIRINNFINNGL